LNSYYTDWSTISCVVLNQVVSWRNCKEEIIIKAEVEDIKLEVRTFAVAYVSTVVCITPEIEVVSKNDLDPLVVNRWR
jgi:hypothetical protein